VHRAHVARAQDELQSVAHRIRGRRRAELGGQQAAARRAPRACQFMTRGAHFVTSIVALSRTDVGRPARSHRSRPCSSLDS
jgi:hypothetical protein